MTDQHPLDGLNPLFFMSLFLIPMPLFLSGGVTVDGTLSFSLSQKNPGGLLMARASKEASAALV